MKFKKVIYIWTQALALGVQVSSSFAQLRRGTVAAPSGTVTAGGGSEAADRDRSRHRGGFEPLALESIRLKIKAASLVERLARLHAFADGERRLFNVAMTRAEKSLTLCCVKDQDPNSYVQQMTAHSSVTAQPELQGMPA